MRKQKDRFKNGLSFWCVFLPIGIFVGVLVCLLRLLGWLKVYGLENLPSNQRSLLVVSNHPSLWEPIVIAGLFFPRCMLNPAKRIPWSVPDQKNYTDTWYWGLLRSRFISVPRGCRRGEYRALVEMKKVLLVGGNIVLFPEGGRTGKGEQFVYSCSGKRMRELKHGVGRIICRTGCTVLPTWVDGAEEVLPIGSSWPRVWRGMTITFGKTFHRQRNPLARKQDFDAADQQVTTSLLRTAG